MKTRLCAALSLTLCLCLPQSLFARSNQKRVPTEQEDLQMLYDASVKQQKALQEMLQKSKALLEDYKKNPQKYKAKPASASRQNTSVSPVIKVNASSKKRNSDGIPVQNLNRKSASSITPSQNTQPQITQKQMDELLRNVEKMQKSMEKRNKSLKQFQ